MSERERAPAGPLVHGRMSFDERDTLMAYLLIHPGVFSEARQVLTPEHFTGPEEVIWAVAWGTCMDLYNQYNGQLPARHIIETEALARIENVPGEVPESGVEELRSLFEYVFNLDVAVFTSPANTPYGFDLLHKFLKERHFADPVKRFVAEIGDQIPADVPLLLEEFAARYNQVAGAGRSAMEDLVPETGWTPEEFRVIPTGFPFLDAPMGGGAARGECYGLLGAFGSGKTMLSCGIMAEAATRAVADAMASGKQPEHCAMFMYETPPDDVRKRIISYIAGIKLKHLDRVPFSQHLSRRGNRHPYEEALFPGDPRGEWERYNDTAPIWRTLHIADMRGPNHNPKAGSGGIDEIHAELEKHRTRYGTRFRAISIDYALTCCRRYISAKGWDVDRKLRHLLGGFGDECRRLIASRFDAQVWILNQLSGQANKRAPGAKVNHADSAEATNFAENLWYCFCLGTKNRENNTLTIDCTKTRRSEGVPAPTILELRGDLARFVQADDRYMLCPHTNRIMDRANGQVVAPTGARAVRPTASRRGGASDALF